MLSEMTEEQKRGEPFLCWLKDIMYFFFKPHKKRKQMSNKHTKEKETKTKKQNKKTHINLML